MNEKHSKTSRACTDGAAYGAARVGSRCCDPLAL